MATSGRHQAPVYRPFHPSGGRMANKHLDCPADPCLAASSTLAKERPTVRRIRTAGLDLPRHRKLRGAPNAACSGGAWAPRSGVVQKSASTAALGVPPP